MIALAKIQPSLFDASPAASPISGLSYIPDFISTEQEAQLISTIDNQPWLDDLKRRVQHYGYKYDYKARSISHALKLGDIPSWLLELSMRLHDESYFARLPDQVIVNEYQAGQGITPHIDCIPCFGEVIASLSLSSPCVMEFSRDEQHQKIPLLLEPRSLVILSGDARNLWRHAIPQRKTDKVNGQKIVRGRRLSLTFRTVILYSHFT